MPIPENLRFSYDDLLSWPENERYELYGGVPVALASPSIPHQAIVGELFAQLHSFLRGKPCKAFLSPVDVRLFASESDAPEHVDTVLVPDLLVVCDSSKIDRRGIRGAPDLIIEILSDSTRRYDLHLKRSLYELAGVREYWVVDPERRNIQVFLLKNGHYETAVIYTSRAVVPVDVLPGCRIDLTNVFSVTLF